MEKGAGRKRLAARRRVLVEWGTESRRTFLDSPGRSAMGIGSERRGGRRREDERKKNFTCVCVGVMVGVFRCVACVVSSKNLRTPFKIESAQGEIRR